MSQLFNFIWRISALFKKRRWCIDNHGKMYERGCFFFCLFFLGDGLTFIFIPLFLPKLQCSHYSYTFYFPFLQAIRNWAFGTGSMVKDDLMIAGLVDSSTSESLVSY